jgi:aspartate racemase
MKTSMGDPMKTAGIIGGIAPESTIDYYRSIIAAYRERRPDGSDPAIIIDSIDMQRMLRLAATDLPGLAEYLASEVGRLARAGADFGLLASNTPHIVFEQLERRSPIPLLSIVEASCEAASRAGLERLGLLGTRFTMEGRFYPEVFARAGIALVPPQPAERALVHGRYMDELVKGIFLPETRAELLRVVEQMKRNAAIDGVVLAGTELPLILRGVDAGIPFLDTTRIHVEAVVERLLQG